MRHIIKSLFIIGSVCGLAACNTPAETPNAAANAVNSAEAANVATDNMANLANSPDEQTGAVERSGPDEQTGAVERSGPAEQ